MPNSTGSSLKHLARPDQWALDLGLKVDGREFSLDGREYIVQVIRDTSPKLIVKKAAQTAFTISFLVRSFHWITQRHWHHLYLLPLKQGAIPFVQKRIDPMISGSSYLSAQFASVDNRLHKQTTDAISILIRGVNIESEMQETPTDVVVFDEYDRMAVDFLEDAKHRTDGSKVKRLTYLSTPTVPGHGLDADDEWYASDMCKWFVPCPHCGRFQTFILEDNVKIGDDKYDCVLECSFCHKVIDDETRTGLNKLGKWEATNLEGNFRGYHINQFNSPTMTITEIMDSFFVGQRDLKKLKSFYNQSLGEPFASPGDQISPELLDKCRSSQHHLGGIPNGAVYLGIDVGHDDLYVKADYIGRNGERCMYGVWHYKDVPGKSAWDMLDENLLEKIGTWVAVCDAHPDKRGAQALSVKYPGRFWLGFEKDRPEQEDTAKFDDKRNVKRGEPYKVIIDRTLAFDSTIHQMQTGGYVLPPEARELGEILPRRNYNGFYSQMIQMVRVEEEDTRGRVVASWKKNKNPDHWHHADMFAFIATMKKPSMIIPASVSKSFKDAGNPVAA